MSKPTPVALSGKGKKKSKESRDVPRPKRKPQKVQRGDSPSAPGKVSKVKLKQPSRSRRRTTQEKQRRYEEREERGAESDLEIVPQASMFEADADPAAAAQMEKFASAFFDRAEEEEEIDEALLSEEEKEEETEAPPPVEKKKKKQKKTNETEISMKTPAVDDDEDEIDQDAMQLLIRLPNEEPLFDPMEERERPKFSKRNLDTENERNEEKAAPPSNDLDFKAVSQRVSNTLELLSNWGQFSKLSEATTSQELSSSNTTGISAPQMKSRQDLVLMLTHDLAAQFGAKVDLVRYFVELFGPKGAHDFLEASEQPRPTTLRTNMLMTRRRDLAQNLISRGVNLDPLADWSKVGLKVYESSVPLGATPEYLAGHYMLQGASSLIPVMALAPQPGERVADLCAAPGGKSTYIAQLMKNQGVLYCNDAAKSRLPALQANLQRMGVINAIVINYDAEELRGVLTSVDRVLLDAPCTGTGIISRDPTVKTKRGPADFVDQSKIQKKLLAAAIDMVNARSATGGCVVYSTCSVSFEENEAVVDYALRSRDVKLVPVGIPFGSPGLTRFRTKRVHPTIAQHCKRIYPHSNNMDGFFIAKFKKISSLRKTPGRDRKQRSARDAQLDLSGCTVDDDGVIRDEGGNEIELVGAEEGDKEDWAKSESDGEMPPSL